MWVELFRQGKKGGICVAGLVLHQAEPWPLILHTHTHAHRCSGSSSVSIRDNDVTLLMKSFRTGHGCCRTCVALGVLPRSEDRETNKSLCLH